MKKNTIMYSIQYVENLTSLTTNILVLKALGYSKNMDDLAVFVLTVHICMSHTLQHCVSAQFSVSGGGMERWLLPV